MNGYHIAPIVEGHGETESIRTLVQRIWTELLGGSFVEVLRPIRQKRNKLVRKQDLQNAVRLALAKLRAACGLGG